MFIYKLPTKFEISLPIDHILKLGKLLWIGRSPIRSKKSALNKGLLAKSETPILTGGCLVRLRKLAFSKGF